MALCNLPLQKQAPLFFPPVFAPLVAGVILGRQQAVDLLGHGVQVLIHPVPDGLDRHAHQDQLLGGVEIVTGYYHLLIY